MRITSTLTFTAPPDRVAEMFSNPDFANHVGTELHADNVTVTQIDNGLTAVFTLATPQSASRILGRQMTLTQTTSFTADVTPDGSRTGRLTMTLAGIPAAADGPLHLRPAGPAGSTMTYDADFVVRIPLVGQKIEQMAASNLEKAIATFEHVGNTWLADH